MPLFYFIKRPPLCAPTLHFDCHLHRKALRRSIARESAHVFLDPLRGYPQFSPKLICTRPLIKTLIKIEINGSQVAHFPWGFSPLLIILIPGESWPLEPTSPRNPPAGVRRNPRERNLNNFAKRPESSSIYPTAWYIDCDVSFFPGEIIRAKNSLENCALSARIRSRSRFLAINTSARGVQPVQRNLYRQLIPRPIVRMLEFNRSPSLGEPKKNIFQACFPGVLY